MEQRVAWMLIRWRDRHFCAHGYYFVSWRSPSWSLLPHSSVVSDLGKFHDPKVVALLLHLRQRLDLLRPCSACLQFSSQVLFFALWLFLVFRAPLLHLPSFELLYLHLALLNLHFWSLASQRALYPFHHLRPAGRRPRALRLLVDIVARSRQVFAQ